MVRDSLDARSVERGIDWPETRGIVTDARVVWAHTEVCYTYSLPSGDYTGKYKMNLPVSLPDKGGAGARRMRRQAQLDLADYPPGAKVVIRYNPQKPSQSLLYCLAEANEHPSQDKADEFAPKFLNLG
jgi:hypothetical protein